MVGLDPKMDGLGTLKNLFCSGGFWSQFRVYGWCDHNMKRRLLKKQLVPTINGSKSMICLTISVKTNHVNHVNHDSAIDELVNQAATKTPPEMESWGQKSGMKHENGDESYLFSWDSLFVFLAPKSVKINSVPKLLVLFSQFVWTFSSKTQRHQRVPGNLYGHPIPLIQSPNGPPWSASR